MDHPCGAAKCGNTMIGPADYDGLKALSEIQGSAGYVLEGPDGPEFFCNDHAGTARKRMNALKPPEPPTPPQSPPTLSAAAQASSSTPPVPIPVVTNPEVKFVPGRCYVVAQTGRVLGVFTTEEQANSIMQMVQALSTEPVYLQVWRPNQPGVQLMEEEADSIADDVATDPLMLVNPKGKSDGKEEKAKRPSKGKRVRQEHATQKEDGQALTGT